MSAEDFIYQEERRLSRTTRLSPCRVYRYTLWREFGLEMFDPPANKFVNFLCLNPSTADETREDNTSRRLKSFTRAWGYSAYCVTNLFAFMATKPSDMMAAADPIGPENDRWVAEIASRAEIVVAAWGVNGRHLGRSDAVRQLVRRPLHCLRLNSDGSPEHPLYLPKTLKPVPFN